MDRAFLFKLINLKIDFFDVTLTSTWHELHYNPLKMTAGNTDDMAT